AILQTVLQRKASLPDIGHMLLARHQSIAPGEVCSFKPSSGGKLPFSLGRQILADPEGVRHGIRICDVYNRMVQLILDRAHGSSGMLPVCTEFIAPPLRSILQPIYAQRRGEDQ